MSHPTPHRIRRTILDRLLSWRAATSRKPLLLDGARQTGKTYLLKEMFAAHYERSVRFDFLESPGLAAAFERSLSPEDIISELSLIAGRQLDPAKELIILDEIGECPRAVQSLKFFAEQMPQAHIAASGSNIGLLGSFPVGKVDMHILRPITFAEFVAAHAHASESHRLLWDAFQARRRSPTAHQAFWALLLDYLFVGGMPEAVAHWLEERRPLVKRVQGVAAIQANLLEGYARDFGKYGGKVNAQLLAAVFAAVPAQLSAALDGSVGRFQFKDIAPRKNRYADFESSIEWLHRSRLVLKSQVVEGRPSHPLAAQAKQNRIKLFAFDVGLLGRSLGLTYPQIQGQGYAYKGFVAENFVAQELAAQGMEPCFSWQDARAEVEFLLTTADGSILPLEVKSSHRTRAKSLASYIHKHRPGTTLKLAGTLGTASPEVLGTPDHPAHHVWPLYWAGGLARLLAQTAPISQPNS